MVIPLIVDPRPFNGSNVVFITRPWASDIVHTFMFVTTDDEALPPLINPSFKSANMRFLSSAGARGLLAVELLRQRSTQEAYINSEHLSL